MDAPIKAIEAPMSTVEFVSFLITIFAQPFLCFFGTLLNLTCIFALLPSFQHSYCRKTSLLIYLIALSICNSIQLTLSIFVLILPAAEQFIDEEVYPQTYTSLRKFNSNTMFYMYPLLMSANYASLWILTLSCAQRFQSIARPNSKWKSRLEVFRKSKSCVFFMVLLALVINFPRYWEPRFNETTQDPYQSLFYKVIQEGLIYGLLVYGLPILILIWLNYNTIKIVWMDNDVASCRTSTEHRTAHMTISFFILFFLCTTMSVSLRLIAIFAGDIFFSIDVLWLVDFSNLLANANALSMPIVVFVFTRGFRDLFFIIRPHDHHHKSLLPVQL